MAQKQENKLATVEIEDGIGYVCIDVAGEKVNTLSSAMTDRFDEILDGLQRESGLEGVVIHSGKPDNFIAGFDIEELKGFGQDPRQLRQLVERGHAQMRRFERLDVPVVAAIDGTCLGGGLEVALACDARVSADTEATSFGFPEVKLGVIPGLGGTQRLPRLIDPQLAMTMILTGKEIDATRAEMEGLVEDVVHPGILLDVAADLARRLNREGTSPVRKMSAAATIKSFFNDPTGEAVKIAAKTPARRFIFDTARDTTRKQAGDDYPAPFKAIDVIETGFRDGFDAGIEAETEAFVELVQTDVAQNLINVFFAKTELENNPGVAEGAEPYEVDKIGVLGAGLMGAGIAQVAAYKNYAVRMKDKDLEGVGWGIDYCAGLFDDLVKKHKLSEAQADVRFGNISGTTDYSGFHGCDLVIEAVFEDLGLKQQMLADIEERGHDEQVFASNTSTIPIAEIAADAERPEMVLGMHFFSPVHKMPLLEIIRTDQTSDRALKTALEVGNRMGKTCIVVDDGPGFFTSRVIGAYINEAGWVLQEGASVEEVDRAMKDFGFPVGPLKLVDEVGFDVAVKAAKTLQEAFTERWDAPQAMKKLADQGRKGRKNEWGFYEYEDGEAQQVDESVYDVLPGGRERKAVDSELVRERCWLAMLNECAFCLQEGIAQQPRDVDIGVIFGLGFPPFRGGIFRHADSVGLGSVVEQMHSLADEFGDRLRPAEILETKAEAGESFYQD